MNPWMTCYGFALGQHIPGLYQPLPTDQDTFHEETYLRLRGTNIARQALAYSSPDALPLLVVLHLIRREWETLSLDTGGGVPRTVAAGDDGTPRKSRSGQKQAPDLARFRGRMKRVTSTMDLHEAKGERQFPTVAARWTPSVLPGFTYLGDASP